MFFNEDDDEDMLVAHYLLQQEASDSRRRRDLDAPPKWPNKRDHATPVMHIYVLITVSIIVYYNTNVAGNSDLSVHVCRFHMHPNVFLTLVQAVENVDPYFHFKCDASIETSI
jgi:hypothetical protein